MKYYGNLLNRLEENKMYCDEVKVGTGVTEYRWSDRAPFEVIEVIDDKHYKVRAYDVKKADDVPYSNNWDLTSNKDNEVKTLVYRYKHWNWEYVKDNGEKVYIKTDVSFGIAEYYYDYEF